MGEKAAILCKRRKNKTVFFLFLISAKVWLQLSGPNAMQNQGLREESRSSAYTLLPSVPGYASCHTRLCLVLALPDCVDSVRGVMGCCHGFMLLQVSVFKLWYVSCESVVILLVWDCLSLTFPDHFPSKILTKGFPGTICTCSVTASTTVPAHISCIYW